MIYAGKQETTADALLTHGTRGRSIELATQSVKCRTCGEYVHFGSTRDGLPYEACQCHGPRLIPRRAPTEVEATRTAKGIPKARVRSYTQGARVPKPKKAGGPSR